MVGLVERTKVDGHRLLHKRRPGLIHAQRDIFLQMAINDYPSLSVSFHSKGKENRGEGREVRTSMFMTLQIKFREEARSPYGNEGWSGRVSPEVRSEPFKSGSGKVVGNDECIRVDKLRVLLQDIRNVLIHNQQQCLAITPLCNITNESMSSQTLSSKRKEKRKKNVH